MKGDSIDIKEDKVVPDWKQRLDYILWLTIFYYFLNAHINITYVGAIIINAHVRIQCAYMHTYGYVHGSLTYHQYQTNQVHLHVQKIMINYKKSIHVQGLFQDFAQEEANT